MKKSRTVIRRRQSSSPALRYLPLVDTQTELQTLVVASGLKVLEAMLEEDRVAVCGPRYAHQPERRASRAGHAPREVVLGGRKVALRRPRVRHDGQEVALPTFRAFAGDDPLNRRVVEQMLVGVATRQYGRSLEPLGPDVRTRGTSKSAVSRRFVAQTPAQLDAWRATPLAELDFAVLLLDGVHVGTHCIVVALGIDVTGQTHALGVWEGATENTTVCQGLLTNLQSRGLRTDRSLLVILDGAKALHTAVTQTFGSAAVLPTVSDPQAAQCAGVSAPGATAMGEGDPHPRLHAPRRHGRPPAVARPRPPPGRRPSECRRACPGRARRDAHGHRVRPLRAPAAVAGHHERRREPSQPNAARQAQREALAGRRDGATLGRGRGAGSPPRAFGA